MNEVEIQARATIAAALIASKTFDMRMVALWEANPLGHVDLAALRTAVDVIYRGLMNPK